MAHVKLQIIAEILRQKLRSNSSPMILIKNSSSRRIFLRVKGLHIWVQNSQRLLIVSRRNPHSKQRILWSLMPNGHPAYKLMVTAYKLRPRPDESAFVWNGDFFLQFGLLSTSTCIWWKCSPTTYLFKNTLQRVKIFENAGYSFTCERMKMEVFKYVCDDVMQSCTCTSFTTDVLQPVAKI